MQLDLYKIPFSRYGSYIAFSQMGDYLERVAGLYLRTVHGQTQQREVFRLELVHQAQSVAFTVEATPTLLRLIANDGVGQVELCLAEPDLVRVRGEGVGLRLNMKPVRFDNAIPLKAEGRWLINAFSQRHKYLLTSLTGQLAVEAPWEVDWSTAVKADFLPDTTTGRFEGVIEECLGSWLERDYIQATFEEALATVQTEYDQWLQGIPAVPTEFAEARELAAYITWSTVVAARGHFSRPAMLMSNNWMNQVWSWDHCFNALALADHQPKLAWDQFMLLFDNQDETGCLPDSLTEATLEWNFCKPPVHGWILGKLMAIPGVVGEAEIGQIYQPLARWTQWWFTYRDYDRNGLPKYNHGNDSGWDNSTVFAEATAVESPDLYAFLVIQLETLSGLARQLNRPEEALKWQQQADQLLERLLAEFWQTDHFVARRAFSRTPINSQSLLLYLPLVLGKRLPLSVQQKLVADLPAYLTEYGLASENPKSALFDSHGYWRGAIWAASTFIITDGLTAIGQQELAQEINRRFCRMVAHNGMSENYDSLTGQGLCDPAFSWTASIFLTLLRQP